MTDLIERLRRTRCPEYSASCGIGCACADMTEAVARIEALEATLEKIADTDPDNGSEWFHAVARRALEAAND